MRLAVKYEICVLVVAEAPLTTRVVAHQYCSEKCWSIRIQWKVAGR